MRASAAAAVPAAVAGLLAACGGSLDPTEAAREIEPWGLEGAELASADLSACDTVIVFALDKVLWSELAGGDEFGATPRIDSILAGAVEVTDAIATSTAGNAALASLLTGRHVTEHGIVSLRDAARQTLPDAERTLAEGFRDAGWTTIFSSGSPLHGRGFSGFAQGFEHYEAPRLSEDPRSAGATGNGALQPLKAALAAGDSVFALVCFNDLSLRALRIPSPEVAAPFVRARLAPLAIERADIEAGLRTLDVDPAKGLSGLAQLLGRARGSRSSAAWNMALRDAYLSLIDGAIGQILDAVEAAGRENRALIVVTGLRGTLMPGYRHEAGALFTTDAIRLPMGIRWPGGAGRGEVVPETASLLDLPWALDAAFSLGLGDTEYRAADLSAWPEARAGSDLGGAALVVDSQRRLFAAVAGDLHVERYSDGRMIVFDRRGDEARDTNEEQVARLSGELQSFVDEATAVRVTWTLTGGDPDSELGVAWETGEGGAIVAGKARPAVRGTFELSGSPGGQRETELQLTRRATAVRARLGSFGSVRLGSRTASMSVSDLPLLYAPLDDVELTQPAEGSPPARLRFERADGLAWTLTVDAPVGSGASSAAEGGETEVLLSVWPPRKLSDALEVHAGGGTRSEPVPGRLDMVRISGRAPLVCRVKKLAKEDFLVACRTPAGFLPPVDMEYHGLRFADAKAFEFVVWHWQPGASDGLPSLDPALFGLLEHGLPADAGPTLYIRRVEFGPPPIAFLAPDAGDVGELVRLAPGE